MENVIRVMIADDHAILRSGLKMLIESQEDMKVVAEADNGEDAVEKAGETSPDVAIVDIKMPKVGGIEAIEKIKRISPQTKILALTMYEDLAYLRAVLAAGGSGYLVKRAADKELLTAVRTVSQGRSYIEVSLVDDVEQDLLNRKVTSGDTSPLSRLSRREREVLEFVAYGYTNRQIAEKIGVSIKSVETYRSRVSEKLGLHTRAELVRFALETGIIGRNSGN